MKLNININHTSPIRLTVWEARGSRHTASRILESIRRLPGVGQVRVSPATGTVVVWLHPEAVNRHKLESAIRIKVLKPKRRELQDQNKKSGEPSLKGIGLQVALTGVVVLWLLVRRLVRGVPPKNQRLINLGSVTTIVAGYPILRTGLAPLMRGKKANVDTLISVATFASLLLKESLAGLVVVWLINLGNLLELWTLRRTRRALEEILKVHEEDVWLWCNGAEVKIPIDAVKSGDVLVVHTWERIPVDGITVEGHATVNESVITGESLPAYKIKGASVYAGTIVEEGRILVKAEKVGNETTMARIIGLVEETQAVKAPIQKAADHFSERFIPFLFLLAGLTFYFTRNIQRTLTILVIACPCAAGLSTPTAVSAAIGNAARRGILIKGGAFLEIAGHLNTLIFDKTGTLTLGRPRVTRVLSLTSAYSPEEVLALAASGEVHSHHPLAGAVLRQARVLELPLYPATDYEPVIGLGVRAIINGRRLTIGSHPMMEQYELAHEEETDCEAERMARSGEAVLFVALGEDVIGLIGIADLPREEAVSILQELRGLGCKRIIMLTGDSHESAAHVARILGLTDFQGGTRPDEKMAIIRKLKEEGCRVGMVGDGVNDAPGLALADVGFAIGREGTEVASEVADIVLLGGDLEKVVYTIRLSQRTLQVIRQNFIAAILVNGVGVMLGILGLISPFTASVIHNASTVGVVLNSAKLLGGAARSTRRLGQNTHLNRRDGI